MAILSQPQILALLQNGTKPEEIESCRKHDRRAEFHTEPPRLTSTPEYRQQHIDFVGTIIDRDKLAVYSYLLANPCETIEYTEGIFDELKKVFEAQNRYIGFEFTNPELVANYDQYLKDIGDQKFWKTEGFKAMKTSINSLVIIDLPRIAKESIATGFPTPYYYLLDVQNIERIGIMRDRIEYLVFTDGHNLDVQYVFDDHMYRVYKIVNGAPVLQEESVHGLGYVPARSFWSTKYNRRSKIQKAGPITNSLSRLDWLLFMYTSTKHAELQAGFPVEVIYEQRCDYTDAEGNSCDNGMVRRTVSMGVGTDGVTIASQIVAEECPTCKNRKGLGAGRLLTAPAMASKDDVDLIQGMHRVPADTDSLEYLLKRIDSMETTIAINMAGYTEADVREAMNKEQVRSRFQSQQTVLNEVKENFESIHKFVLETVARLRYGKAFIAATVNYGDKFFIHSVDELQTELEKSRKNGFPVYEVVGQINQIIATKYKENPSMLERARTLAAIEPYQGYDVNQLVDLNEKIGLVEELVRLKIDFEAYVNRFEREYMPISQFMPGASFESKVDLVREIMLGYVTEDYPEEPAAESVPPAGGVPPTPGVPPVDQPGPDSGAGGTTA